MNNQRWDVAQVNITTVTVAPIICRHNAEVFVISHHTVLHKVAISIRAITSLPIGNEF